MIRSTLRSPIFLLLLAATILYWMVVVPLVPPKALSVLVDCLTVAFGLAVVHRAGPFALRSITWMHPHREEMLVIGAVLHWFAIAGFRVMRIAVLNFERPGGTLFSPTFDYLSVLQLLGGALIMTAFTRNGISFPLRLWRATHMWVLLGVLLAIIVINVKN